MKIVYRVISYILVAALAAGAALYFAPTPEVVKEESKLDQLSGIIEEMFIGEADKAAYEDAAAAAMVDALGDEWSYYIPASEYQAHLEVSNNFYVGIGITIQAREDKAGFDVVQVNEGGSAESAGMLPGDVIVGIDGQSTVGMTTGAAQELVLGEENTTVSITVLRGEAELTLEILRKRVPTTVAVGQMLEGNIGLVSIFNFGERCFDESKAVIDQLLQDGATSLIFDVRNNPGGLKSEQVKLLDYLLPEGDLFHGEDYTGRVIVEKSDSNHLDIPMAVLVNGYSYSAAEYFAAVLSEYDAAVVVGQQTYGKGYFQYTITLKDGSAVVLSSGKYTTPSGVNLAGVGITPDIVVEVDEETDFAIYARILDPADDPQIQAAVAALKAN